MSHPSLHLCEKDTVFEGFKCALSQAFSQPSLVAAGNPWRLPGGGIVALGVPPL